MFFDSNFVIVITYCPAKLLSEFSMFPNGKSKLTILFLVATFVLSANAVSAVSAVSSYKGYSKLPEPPATSKGESIYRESDCALCHGELGDGGGFLASGLSPKPRDFTSFLEMQTIPDLQMESAIRDGVKGTGMPAHPDFSVAQVEELILYLRSLLAETYLTINLCLTATHTVDTGIKGLDLDEFQVKVDNPDLIKIEVEGSKVHISPAQNWSTLKTFMSKRVVRTHVKLIEKDNTLSLIAVRVHRCIK